MKKIHINSEFIKLQQVLKLATVVSQGSDAKNLILDEKVKVNGIIEKRRSKKIKDKDIIEVEGFGKYIVINNY